MRQQGHHQDRAHGHQTWPAVQSGAAKPGQATNYEDLARTNLHVSLIDMHDGYFDRASNSP
jgi:hypothetical protein